VEIKDAVAVVTGGASGLGLATAKALLAEGAKVVILDLPTSKGEDVAAELGDRVRFAAADVTDEDTVTKAFDLAETLGPVRIVVNCAGTGDAIRVLGKQGVYPLSKFARIVNINLVGTFNVLRLGAERMVKTDAVGGERGVIINTASVAAFDGQIGQAAYSASPGLFDTPLLAGLPEPAKASLGEQVPHPSRLGSPSEYGALAVHIVQNPMLNGEVIRLDGAIRMAPR
jgi:NAD(P)-dependent dehydrogenase (short-subunit alcohol dehydrogenase family)